MSNTPHCRASSTIGNRETVFALNGKHHCLVWEQCLESGISDVNHVSIACKLTSPRGSTALHECSARAGEDINSVNWHYMETAKLLLEAGADPFVENSKGEKRSSKTVI